MGDLKATTVKDAIKNWEEVNNESASEAIYVGLQFQWPPIEKMDNSLSVLTKWRNYIKAFTGLEQLSDTLEELWISYNLIEKMKGILGMRKLKILYMSNNNVKEWAEVIKLADMESLQDFLFVGKIRNFKYEK
ncbi:dynein axonemal light chain 1-like isoform X2 [Daktulosphaira vitifoliae]|uniref:dynein axonemal light chain 1-like isoform X2 n=1 Tax=Daktulosphaira vitifoliae TaxID=58002 RepID=UPI0021A9AB14|nr:dynein axonemal light chain 1-like isoform X2 [Daktulosphaira vitifoliae]